MTREAPANVHAAVAAAKDAAAADEPQAAGHTPSWTSSEILARYWKLHWKV